MTIEINIKGDNYVLLTPMNFANAMVEQGIFKVDELEELAEYLLVFCRHNEDDRGCIRPFVKRFHSNADMQED